MNVFARTAALALAAVVSLSAFPAVSGCSASRLPAAATASPPGLPAAPATPGARGSSAAADTTRGRPETARHRVRVTRNYYVSLCWYGFGQLGYGGKKANPEYAGFGRKLTTSVGDLGFRQPMIRGPIFQLIFQLPGYFDPRSQEEMADLFAAVRRFIRSGSLDEFRPKWPAQARALEEWFPDGAKSYFQNTFGGREEVVNQALDTWALYMRILWPRYKSVYEAKLADYPFEAYESQCNRLGAFEAWQRELGVEYPYADLVLVVCPENPTMATSIGPDKIVFGAMHSLEDLKNSAVHEVGVRLPSLSLLFQHPATSAAMITDYDGMLRLVQTEICYRTPRILPGLSTDNFVTGMRIEKLMAWRSGQEQSGGLPDAASAGPAELLSELYARAKKDGVI